MDVSASVSGEARGGTLVAGGCSSLGEGLFSAEAAILGLASSGVCSLGMSGAVGFCRQRIACVVCVTVPDDEEVVEAEEEVGSVDAEPDESSCISPLLSKTLGYVGPQSTSQQFLMMFLWLYGFWTLFFPDQDPLMSSLVVWFREMR